MIDTPTKLERAVQIAVAAACALGTLLLGLGQQSVFLPCIGILAAVGSVILTDSLQRFCLNRNLANIAALLAVAYSMVGVLFGDADNQTALIAVANLLVYLQIVLQFQQKNLRIYWSLSVLSLLQVTVASALNLSVSFGPLLVVYLVVALTSLSLLFVHRETTRFHDDEDPTDALPPGPRRRWPLARGQVAWSGVVGDDLARPLVGPRLAKHVLYMCLVTTVVTALIFFGVPRGNSNPWRSTTPGQMTVTGFSDEVTLGNMGRILQSDEEALRVTFLHYESEVPFRVSGECYLRGAALSRYRGGRWTGDRNDSFGYFGEGLPTPNPRRGGVIQDIKLDTPLRPSMAGRYSVLFSTYPVYRDGRPPFDLEVDQQRRLLLVDNTTLPDVVPQLHYTVRSGAFRGTTMPRFTPTDYDFRQLKLMRLEADQIPALPNIIAIAQQIVDEANATTDLEKALAIEQHFLVPNRYDYDLDPDVTRTPGVDQVEDFVANHRTGHCEYFASAMVLMLRSQGIPARMVVGYKGGEWNSVGNHYQFRQRHAHAWVEAYFPPGEFPANQLAEASQFQLGNGFTGPGAWLRLDPTPADYDAEVADTEIGMMSRVNDMVDYVQILWDDYILGLNSEKQNEAIYQPILDGIADFLETLRAKGAWLARGLIGLAAGLVGIALVVLTIAFFTRRTQGSNTGEEVGSLLSATGRWISTWLHRNPTETAHARKSRVEFYERLETLLSRQGLQRPPGQTQREFAAAAGGTLADVPHLQTVAGVPRRVAQAFYQIRFGGLELDDSQQRAVDQALSDLETAIDGPARA